jgi:hypothetical protein
MRSQSNDDYLYTLSLFVLEPIVSQIPSSRIMAFHAQRVAEMDGKLFLAGLDASRARGGIFINTDIFPPAGQADPRPQAYRFYWTEIGRRMGIHSIPPTLAALKEWSTNFEQRAFVPDDDNMAVAEYTMAEIQSQLHVPQPLRGLGRRLVVTMLDDKTRIAMKCVGGVIHPSLNVFPPLISAFVLRRQPAQPWYLHLLSNAVLYAVMLFHRYLSLPRTRPWVLVPLDLPAAQNGRIPRMHTTRCAPVSPFAPVRTQRRPTDPAPIDGPANRGTSPAGTASPASWTGCWWHCASWTRSTSRRRRSTRRKGIGYRRSGPSRSRKVRSLSLSFSARL